MAGEQQHEPPVRGRGVDGAAVAAARGRERPVGGGVERILEAGVGEQALGLDRAAVAGEVAVAVAVVEAGEAALVLAVGVTGAGPLPSGVDGGRAGQQVMRQGPAAVVGDRPEPEVRDRLLVGAGGERAARPALEVAAAAGDDGGAVEGAVGAAELRADDRVARLEHRIRAVMGELDPAVAVPDDRHVAELQGCEVGGDPGTFDVEAAALDAGGVAADRHFRELESALSTVNVPSTPTAPTARGRRIARECAPA